MMGFHSTILRPESVSRVMPPTRIISKMKPQVADNQRATGRWACTMYSSTFLLLFDQLQDLALRLFLLIVDVLEDGGHLLFAQRLLGHQLGLVQFIHRL